MGNAKRIGWAFVGLDYAKEVASGEAYVARLSSPVVARMSTLVGGNMAVAAIQQGVATMAGVVRALLPDDMEAQAWVADGMPAFDASWDVASDGRSDRYAVASGADMRGVRACRAVIEWDQNAPIAPDELPRLLRNARAKLAKDRRMLAESAHA